MRHACGRDGRIDLLRGLAVLAMIVDHVAGYSPLRLLTGGDRFYTSAAEAFVVVAGITAGIITLRSVERGTLQRTLRRFAKRAALLYLVVTALTLVELPISESLGLPWARGIDLHQPLQLGFDIATMGQTYHIADVLVLYTLLFLLAPLAAYLLARGKTAVLLGASVVLWAGYQVAPDVFGLSWLAGRNGTYGFPLAAWQVLFCVSMAAGYHRATLARRLTRAWRNRLLLLAGLTSLGLLVLYNDTRGPFLTPHAVAGAQSLFGQDAMGRGFMFAKDAMRAGRLIATASVISLLFALASVLRGRARAIAELVLLPFGRNSLLAFVLHLVVVVGVAAAASVSASQRAYSPEYSALLQLLAIAFVWMSVKLLLRLKSVPRPRVGVRVALAWQTATALLRG